MPPPPLAHLLLLLIIIIILASWPLHTSALIGLSVTEKDCLCAARQFRTYQTGWERMKKVESVSARDDFCVRHGFFNRWKMMFPGRLELGIGSGLRAQLFKSAVPFDDDYDYLLFAFRHNEHQNDTWIDYDYWQELAYFGDERLERFWGKWMADSLSRLVFLFRRYLGIDYHHSASAFVEEILSRGKKKKMLFTGFGEGGLSAMMQVGRYEPGEATGVVFSARQPTLLQLSSWGLDLRDTTRVVNLYLKGDANDVQSRGFTLPDRRANKMCWFEPNTAAVERLLLLRGTTKEPFSRLAWAGEGGGGEKIDNGTTTTTVSLPEILYEATVYSDDGLLAVTGERVCLD